MLQDSATHTSRSLKSSVDVTWQAPGDSTSDVTLWYANFSRTIVRGIPND